MNSKSYINRGLYAKTNKNNKHPLTKRLPLTKIRFFIAGLIYLFLKVFFLSDNRSIKRKGINYQIDLSEGIDLSLFLFRNFQKHICDNTTLQLSKDSVIFDVGANFGDMALKFAKLAPDGKVYAFEPTHYGFSKLKRNLSLNPVLCESVVSVQSFLSSQREEHPDIKAYASWKINSPARDGIHPLHCGTLKSAEGISATTIDDFCKENNIKKIDFIKIDTDGHEWNVLKGAERIIKKCKPKIIFEIGFYLMEENNTDFFNFYNFFSSLNYRLLNCKNKKHINIKNYYTCIPQKSTIDILAIPVEKLNGISQKITKRLRKSTYSPAS